LFETLNTEKPVPDVPDVPDSPSLGSYLTKHSSTEIKNPTEIKSGTTGTSGTNFTEDGLTAVKSWLLANRNERSEVSLVSLTEFLSKDLKIKSPSYLVSKILDEGKILMPSPKAGKAVVI